MFKWRKTETPNTFQGQLDGVKKSHSSLKMDVAKVDSILSDLRADQKKLLEKIETLETKVANLNAIITAVAEGFNKAMEGLANEQS